MVRRGERKSKGVKGRIDAARSALGRNVSLSVSSDLPSPGPSSRPNSSKDGFSSTANSPNRFAFTAPLSPGNQLEDDEDDLHAHLTEPIPPLIPYAAFASEPKNVEILQEALELEAKQTALAAANDKRIRLEKLKERDPKLIAASIVKAARHAAKSDKKLSNSTQTAVALSHADATSGLPHGKNFCAPCTSETLCSLAAWDPEFVFVIDIQIWLPLLSATFLHRLVRYHPRICLRFTETSSADFSLDLIERLVGSLEGFVVEIIFDNCRHLSWSSREMKTLFGGLGSHLQSLVFSHCPWVEDAAIEFIAKRISPTLKCLSLYFCPLGNNACFMLARKFNQLDCLAIVGCGSLSDGGFIELSKSLKIRQLFLGHMSSITDRGLGALVGSSTTLESLAVVHCTRMTDTMVQFLFECKYSWGIARNNATAGLRFVCFRDLPQLTSSAAVYLSSATQAINELDLRDCPGINPLLAMQEFIHLPNLRKLRIGPCEMENVDGEKFIRQFEGFGHNLELLELYGLGEVIGDEEVAALLDFVPNLDHLILHDVPIGTATVESLCGNLPHLLTLSVDSSEDLKDADVRCIMSICKDLVELRIRRCPLLTDAAFQRFFGLHNLEICDLSHVSPQVTMLVVKYMTASPLRELYLDGITFANTWNCFHQLLPSMNQSLRHLSLRQSPEISLDIIRMFLDRFVFLKTLDLSGSFDLDLDRLKSLPHSHPFVSYVYLPEFFGFQQSKLSMIRSHIFLTASKQYARHQAARVIQHSYTAYQERLGVYKRGRRNRWEAFRLHTICTLQALVRGYFVRKQVKIKLQAGRLIVSRAKTYLIRSQFLTLFAVRQYYRKKLRTMAWLKLQKWRQTSETLLREKENKLRHMLRHGLMARRFRDWWEVRGEIKERRVIDSALVFWEINILRKILFHWRKVIGKSTDYKQLLVHIFMNIVPLTHHNSLRQLGSLKKADSFRQKRLLALSWIALAKDRMLARKIELWMPVAAEHARERFFLRVVGQVFDGIREYRILKQRKRAALAVAQKWRFDRLFNSATRCMRYNIKSFVRQKNMLRIADLSLRRLRLTLSFSQIKRFFRKCITEHERIHSAEVFNRNYLVYTGFGRLKLGVTRLRNYRRMVAIAVKTWRSKTHIAVFGAWKQLWSTAKSLRLMDTGLYYNGLKLRVFRAMVKFRDESIAIRTQLLSKIANNRGISIEEAYEKIDNVILAQALIRGHLTRAKFSVMRVNSLYSVQVLQNWTRTMLARFEVQRRKRVRMIEQLVREEFELQQMREAEAETLYYNYHIDALTTIQRAFRGWKARNRVRKFRLEHFRQVARDQHDDNLYLKQHHEAFRRAQIAKELLKQRCAIQIQKIIRGHIGRLRFAEEKQNQAVARHAVCVQRAYKRRLAIEQLRSLRRLREEEYRHVEVLRRRGKILRSVGLFTRSMQNRFKIVLDTLGLDPSTFHYSLHELVKETVNDFKDFMVTAKREKELFVEHKLDKYNRDVHRRKMLLADGLRFRLQDAVRIVEPGHRHYGRTGRIVRIDDTLIGLPMIEVSLDLDRSLTTVRMSLDPNILDQTTQSIVRIEAHPPIRHYRDKFRLFTEERPLYSRRMINSAWIIQRAFRCHRARATVARRRYEKWQQYSMRQWAVYYQLAEMNSLNAHGYSLAGIFNARSPRPVRFDEIAFKFQPTALLHYFNSPEESKFVSRELAARRRDRLVFLQKSALMRKTGLFTVGSGKLNVWRKLGALLNASAGLYRSGAAQLKDLFGAKGARFLSKHKSMVSGTDQFVFEQMRGSPHVSYPKATIYQGEWSGIPLFTPLKPHGEGLAIFLDAWGFSKEDKVLYLRVVRCSHLQPMDLTTSDPYCDIYCNGINVQTSVKYKTLFPEYFEDFEIDATNPSATLLIQVKDKDFFNSDDLIGQVEIPLETLSDGKEHNLNLPLKDEEMGDGGDLGEIEIIARWAERTYEDDQIRLEFRARSVIRIQTWLRRILATRVYQKLAAHNKEFMKLVRQSAVKITCLCRMRIAIKVYKRLLRNLKSVLKIQKRVRIWIAKKVFHRRKLSWTRTVRVQCAVRVYLAKCKVARRREELEAERNAAACVIQKYARRMKVLFDMEDLREELVNAYREEKRQLEMRGQPTDHLVHPINRSFPPVSEWINTYGRDQEYGLKRNRRITERIFQRMLRTRYVRLVSKYGTVYVDSYPPRKSEEEVLDELQGIIREKFCEREDFVSSFLPTFEPIRIHRHQAIDMFEDISHTAILHIPTAIDMRKSVHYMVCTVQSLFRQRVARLKMKQMLRINRAFAIFQRKFRERYEKLHNKALIITAFIRGVRDIKYVRMLRKEHDAVCTLQRAYRCYAARSQFFDLRSVDKLSVLRSIPEALPHHGADRALEHRSDTYWIVETTEMAEMRVEFSAWESVIQIWVLTNLFQCSPQYVSVDAVVNKSVGYQQVLPKTELMLMKGERWHRFDITLTHAKFFRVRFYENYGDDKYTGVRQVRFIRSREKSAEIIEQPRDCIFSAGPAVGTEGEVVLKCQADGWPVPTYQWYWDDMPISHANQPELRLRLFCEGIGEKNYRCARCKMVGIGVPMNAYHIECGNCKCVFVNKEVDLYDTAIDTLKATEKEIQTDRLSLQTSLVQIESFNNPMKYRVVLQDLRERIDILNQKLTELEHRRFTLKARVPSVNNFTNEGIYTCVVTNYRGGTMKIIKRSRPVVVVVERPRYYVVEVSPFYQPRAQVIRRRWNIYSSILGTFRHGKVDGLVVIRYNDGSFYEGPYIDEDALDEFGRVRPSARLTGHYGLYRLKDGRVFEGENVDNHFDPHNLQSYYRLTFPNGEVYEGRFCDEQFHGIGMYQYADGSVYEGQWHRGTRFGHGHYRSSENWTYEGFFDRDRRHRQGVIDWPDGSCYMGDWFYGQIQGRGIFITPLRDIYKGEFQDGKYHGFGELTYSDGSVYIGEFCNGLRHGKGVMIENTGVEYYGHFRDDLQEGEHVVKIIIPIEEPGQDNFEIRIGVYERGILMNWKSKFSNPLLMKQFINLFRNNREMFDSVFSMILARMLPGLPEGIDPNHPDVKRIITKIRSEAGMLVGQQALSQAKQKFDSLLIPLREKEAEVDSHKRDIESLSMDLVRLERESHTLELKSSNYMSKWEKDTLTIEEYWLEEPKQVRQAFRDACSNLEKISPDDYFDFRNHRVVPPFVKRVFDALSLLLRLPRDWKDQQLLVADSLLNARAGDEDARRLTYSCKLVHIMQNYDVYNYVPVENLDDILDIVADVRFRPNSFYIESLGKVGPALVTWINTNLNYLLAATRMYSVLNGAEQKKIEAFRYKSMHSKKREEITDLTSRLNNSRESLRRSQLELEDLQHALLKAKDLLEFIQGRFSQTSSGEARQDYYKLLEAKLEAKRDFFNIEVCLRSLVDNVIEKVDREERTLKLQAFAMGKEYTPPTLTQYSIVDWIRDEVISQQTAILNSGRTLGYEFDPEPTDVSRAYTAQLVSLIVDIVIGKMNDQYNDLASALSWLSLDGRVFNSRFLFVKIWQIWEAEAVARRDSRAIEQWESIFGDEETCALMAVESRVNTRMSSVARKQAKVWATSHMDAMRAAEERLAASFAAEHNNDISSITSAAYEIESNWDSDSISPSQKAACLCWISHNHTLMQEKRDEKLLARSESFLQATGKGDVDLAATICFKILNGLATSEESRHADDAPAFKSFHEEEYAASGEIIVNENAKDFTEHFPLSTYYEAARIITNHELSKVISHVELKKEISPHPKQLINAYCWGMLHQGMLKKGKDMVEDENDKLYQKQWTELRLLTDNFTRGNAVLAHGQASSNSATPSPPVELENDEDPSASTEMDSTKDLSSVQRERGEQLRAHVSNKYAWLHGWLSYRCEMLLNRLGALNYNDPIFKVQHRVRPSEAKKIAFETEEKFLEERESITRLYMAALGRLTTLNTYLGRETKYQPPVYN